MAWAIVNSPKWKIDAASADRQQIALVWAVTTPDEAFAAELARDPAEGAAGAAALRALGANVHKLGVEDRTQAVLYALRYGWVRLQ